MYRRKDYLRICKYRFLLFLSHLSLSRLWQRLFFSRFLILIENIFFHLSHKIIEILFFKSLTIANYVISFVTIVTSKCIYLIECRSSAHFTIIRILIIRIQFRYIRSKFCIWDVRLLATWFLIIQFFLKIDAS